MESYPGELLAGVFPLVFAVDAILPSPSSTSLPKDEASASEQTAKTESSSTAAEDATIEQSGSHPRSLFDRFLDAVAASLVDEEQPPPTKGVTRSGSDTITSLLRGEDEFSDDEDDLSEERATRRNSFRRSSPIHLRFKRNSIPYSHSMSYARALSTEVFFQRARILSVSTRHGFPPSKDPDGTQNRALVLSQARATMAQGATGANALRLKNILENQPILEGILPAGWLEKHVHALPSVLLVVTTLTTDHQEAQKQHLLDTMEHLNLNLAPKRDCHIHVVCLIEEPSMSVFTTDAWITFVRHHTELPPTSITLLSASKDLEVDMPTTPAMRELHVTIRDASLSYYLQQARRAKKKHAVLGHERQPTLLPLAARYCFKIGVFYEFQLRHEKSLKFFAEAYRHVQTYYQYLLDGSPPPPPEVVNPQDHDIAEAEEANEEEEVGIEVSLADTSDDEEEEEEAAPPPPPPLELKRVLSQGEAPDDMTHQCRAVADWLNFKLLQAGFTATALGEPVAGLLAASSQWRKHAQVFLREQDVKNPSWNHWSYVAHQRLVMSQLVERHPPGEEVEDEVWIRCSPWRNYLAAAEAELRLEAELKKELENAASSDKLAGRSMRQKFVGGLDSDGLSPKLHEESQENHAQNALQLTLRAIELFEQEVDKIKQKESTEEDEEQQPQPFIPSGARLYYLVGGILLSMDRHQDAIPYLEKAALHSTNWDGIESSIRKMLVVCYDKHMPPPAEDTTNDAKMLDMIFRSGLELQDVRRVLASYSTVRGGDELKWHGEITNESDTSLPFSFSVTFPGVTHATAGDSVTASVVIKSNLDYPVHVNSIILLSAVGQVSVPSDDLERAENADPGTNGGIVIKPMAAIVVSTEVFLPKGMDKNASDDTATSAADKGGSQAKPHTVVSARPRAAGIAAGAGARLVSEELFGSREHSAQWSKTNLGGKPLRCDGMRLVFAPVFDDNIMWEEGAKLIEVAIMKKKPKSVAPPKRTPFEENNYIESAWSRPSYAPLLLGPRCLRVLGPMPKMTVTNLTNPMTNGKTLEGTVNRVLFKLQAGDGEFCYDLKFKVTCSSMLLSADGTTTHLTPEKGVPPSTDGEAEVNMVGMRPPVMVSPDESSIARRTTEFGYDLPPGWRLVGNGHASDEMTPNVSDLKAGECTYVCFELYRPPHCLEPLESPYEGDAHSTHSGQSNEEADESEICQTNFDITITYRQSRPANQKPEQDDRTLTDSVVLEHSGSVVWESPISAEFFLDKRSQRAFPSGSRHPSNYVSAVETERTPATEEQSELALIHGERTSTRCLLKSNVAGDGLGLEIARIGFEEKDGTIDKGDTGCELLLRSTTQSGTPGVLYTPSEDDSSRRLVAGSRFGLTYTVEPRILDEYMKGSVSTRLGVIWVDWCPVPIPLPDELPNDESDQPFDSGLSSVAQHGPLRMKEPPTLKFRGPPCYIENAPFETVLQSLPPAPRVATPFEMSYRISNKTGMHQKLSVLMSEQSADDGSRNSQSDGVLVSGLVKGDIHLAPYESQTLSYTALATKAGKTTIPSLSISCDRYQTWIVKDNSESNRVVFVMP